MTPDYTYRALLLDVHDGDTMTVMVDCGFRMFAKVPLRLRGLDTPELNTPEGKASREATQQWCAHLPNGACIVRTWKDPEKYGRWLAIVSSPEGGGTLNEYLLSNGWAVPYDGGAR